MMKLNFEVKCWAPNLRAPLFMAFYELDIGSINYKHCSINICRRETLAVRQIFGNGEINYVIDLNLI